MSESGLVVANLSVAYGERSVLDSISFTVARGETLGVVGRSGAGKSTVINSVMGLLPSNARVDGSITLDGRSLVGLDESEWQSVRGGMIGMIPQDQYGWFNPVRRLGVQLRETVRAHAAISKTDANEKAQRLLMQAGLEDYKRVFSSFPFQLSGGMRQRACIAAALAGSPSMLVADEPTSALDAAVQSEIVDLLTSLRTEDRAMLIVSHDADVIERLCDRVITIEDGKVHEGRATSAPVVRSLDTRSTGTLAVEIDHVSKRFGRAVAIRDVSLTISKGETLGLVGESGSGKSTLAHLMCGLDKPSSGSVRLGGADARTMSRRARASHVSLVFQDTAGSLDPRYRVRDIVAEPLVAVGVSKDEATKEVVKMLGAVGLGSEYILRRPHELSGGQRQRVGIARALIGRPELIVLDEPTSALDAETRNEVLEIIGSVQSEFGIAAMFISHDMKVVRAVADRVELMKDGVII